MIPKLYHGRNKSFFYAAYQGYRYSTPSNSELLVPTDAELAGNENDNQQLPIYNPFETVPATNAGGATFITSGLSEQCDSAQFN